jgi:hypothetical protein
MSGESEANLFRNFGAMEAESSLLQGSPLSHWRAPQSSHEAGDIGQSDSGMHPGLDGNVSPLPDGIELLLVFAHALEIVETV